MWKVANRWLKFSTLHVRTLRAWVAQCLIRCFSRTMLKTFYYFGLTLWVILFITLLGHILDWCARIFQLLEEQSIDVDEVQLYLSVVQAAKTHLEKRFKLVKPLYFDYIHLVRRSPIEGNTCTSNYILWTIIKCNVGDIVWYSHQIDAYPLALK